MSHDDLTADAWVLERTINAKRQGQVWEVSHPETHQRGYYKFAYPHQWFAAGPIISNEWIARFLAQEVGLYTADLAYGTILDSHDVPAGVVSLCKESSALTDWRHLSDANKQTAHKDIKEWELLLGTVVFDIWTTNIDRGSGTNIVLYQVPDHRRWRWYLIDHGYVGYGSPRKWRTHSPLSRYWHRPWEFYHIPKGWKPYVKRDVVASMTERIQSIPDQRIAEIVHTPAEVAFTDALRKDTIALLTYRKRVIAQFMNDWLLHPGPKECTV